MQIYSSLPYQRMWQILTDLLAIAAVVIAWLLSRAAHDALSQLSAFGRGMEDAGSGFQSTMSDAAENIGGVPIIGDEASAPFLSAADAGGFLISAGQDQQGSVAQAATIVGLSIFLIPVLLLVPLWLVPRIRFMVRSARTRQLSAAEGGRELLALRALMVVRPSQLQRVSDNPVRAWREGNPETLEELAQLALKHAGVKAQ